VARRGSYHRSAYRSALAALVRRPAAALVDRNSKLALPLLFLSLLLVPAARAQAPAKPASPPSSSSASPQTTTVASLPAPPQPQAIPLAKIVDQAEALDRQLREINGEMIPSSELLEEEGIAEKHAAEIRQRELEAAALLAGTPTILEIEDEQRYWRSHSTSYAKQRALLTQRAAQLEGQIRLLDAQLVRWQATLDQIQEQQGINVLIDRTRQKLDAIRTTRAQAQERLNRVLTLQSRVAELDEQTSNTLAELRAARDAARSRLLEQESLPLWDLRALRTLDQSAPHAVGWPFDRSFTATVEFLHVHKLAISLLLFSYMLALLGALQLKRGFERGKREEVPHEAARILAFPFSLALVFALIATESYIASAPMGITLIFYLLYLIPVLRLMVPLAEPGLRAPLHVLALFYTLAGLFLLVQWAPLLKRELFAVIVFAALLSFGWLVRPSRLRGLSMRGRSLRLLTLGIGMGLVLLAASLVANIFGFVSLAQILGLTALLGAFLAVALFCAVRVLALVLTLVLQSEWARRVFAMRAHSIELWGDRILALGASLLWLVGMLKLFTVYDNVVDAVAKTLQQPLRFERLHITLGGILSFFFVLLVGYALANACTLALRTALVAKFPSRRGLPFAISQLTYYLLLVLVFLAALSNAGVDLDRFTVITGALGVGVGFGLQNIVNNFVSGLVLLLERPIHEGDIVEIGAVSGTVRRIGARSISVLTAQGAQVVVPNSDILSKQVINWTMGSPCRRAEIDVGVAHGTDIERVLRLLVEVAGSHSGVLRERPPAAFFLGFGESALNFQLQVWAADQKTWFQVKSDVATAVAKALRDANIMIPFPQRDLHVRSVSAPVEETLVQNAQPTPSSAEAPRSKRSRVTMPAPPSED
jgi:potassium-dependent mechanosensitive channel